MSAKISPSPPLYTKVLVYCALQAAFVSFLFAYYDVEAGRLIRPVFDWLIEKVEEVPVAKSAIDTVKSVVSVNEPTENEDVQRPRKKISKPKEAINEKKLDLGDDVSYLPVFSREQLALFDGSRPSKDVYLALLGRVYNVQRGHKHYAPGGGYHFFAGKDATRAFVTGDFSDEGLTDDVSGLSHQDILGIKEWSNFYEKEYELIGLLQGTYYDSHGQATQRLREVLGMMEDAKLWKAAQTKESEVFPPCNSEWHKDSGGRVWCTSKSGGIHREWVGVPRKLFNPGAKTSRCACVKNFGPPLSVYPDRDEEGTRGDLSNPNLHEYPGCSPTSNSCKLQED
ncbi:unnamed protein product [Anisakis simplex]|uniref:Neuferricin homolog (inferred by orthology to a C. elegans protein) n=1 Tax=Anisakis simplex TaxID=6269 RepID=A0A0M3JZV9_ANISI|nr:unnamed protein product [Anisakis simplex]